jgi:Flp pilus assembly pilin Flp
MNPLLQTILPFFREESGPTYTEYAVLLGLIIVICIGVITTFGQNVHQWFFFSRDGLAPVPLAVP